MSYASDHKQRLDAALKLLDVNTTSFDKLTSLKVLLTDLDPRFNKLLDDSFRVLSDLRKLQKGDVIELSADHLPERDEREKKRKKLLLLFIKTWKDLKSETLRVRKELSTTSQSQWLSYGRIIKFAKGPFGIVTLAALVIVGVSLFTANKKNVKVEPANNPPITQKAKMTIKVIEVNGKKIPISELRTGIGSECTTNKAQAPHYHAKNQSTVRTLDGTTVTDPGGCGFGKVDEVKVFEIEQ